SVTAAHRLLKNHVQEATGWRGYALFTEMCLSAMDIYPISMHGAAEQYEHIGDVQTYSINLDERYRELTEEKRVVLEPDQADMTCEAVFKAPAAVVWDWLNDPMKRARWQVGSGWHAKERPAGRTGRGSS